VGARKSFVTAELRVDRGGRGRNACCAALRLIYLVFSQLVQWAVLVARDAAAKDAELLVLRQ
jgi:hypothetical protein